MTDQAARQRVREVVGAELSDDEADALIAISTAMSRAVAAMPAMELKGVEPPLRSVPGPRHP